MKKLFVLVFFAFIGYAFVVNQDFRGNLIDEARNVYRLLLSSVQATSQDKN